MFINNIKATKLSLNEELKDYIEKKMAMLDRYLGRIPVTSCHIEIGLTPGGQQSGEIYRAEVNLVLPGEMIRVEKCEKDIFKAIDKVKDHLARSIKEYKAKRIEKRRRPA
jgi:ribosomal subunit interface protein